MLRSLAFHMWLDSEGIAKYFLHMREDFNLQPSGKAKRNANNSGMHQVSTYWGHGPGFPGYSKGHGGIRSIAHYLSKYLRMLRDRIMLSFIT